jgi:hypothetical protein
LTHPDGHDDAATLLAAGYAARAMKPATSCGAICIRRSGAERIDAEGAEILVEVAALASTIASIPAAFARSTRLSRAPSPAGSSSRRYRAAAASPGTGWRRDGLRRAPPPSACADFDRRQDGLDAFAGRHDSPPCRNEPRCREDRPSHACVVDRRLVGPSWVEPGPMRAGDLAPGSVTAAIIAGQVSVGNARRADNSSAMEAQISGSVQIRNAAFA